MKLIQDLFVGYWTAAKRIGTKMEQVGKQLPRFFLCGHPGNGVFDPPDLFGGKIVRFGG